MAKKIVKADVARKYLKKFPNAALKTLARKAYKAEAPLWPTLRACRRSFQYISGTNGTDSRRAAADKSLYREPGKPGNAFGTIPEGMTSYDDWASIDLPTPCKVLVLADVHVPYHDRDALMKAVQRGIESNCTDIVLLGDFLDCYALSRWENDPRKRDFANELAAAKAILEAIRLSFPKARFWYKIGNHEERYERYMMLKAPELLDVVDFDLATLLGCEDLDVTVVRDKRLMRFGKLYALHGHEYRFAISNPVNPARGLFLRGGVGAICAHFHQVSHHSEKHMDGDVISCWSVGCLSDMHPEYMPLNKWSFGFAVIDVNKSGAYSVENYRIIDGEIWR